MIVEGCGHAVSVDAGHEVTVMMLAGGQVVAVGPVEELARELELPETVLLVVGREVVEDTVGVTKHEQALLILELKAWQLSTKGGRDVVAVTIAVVYVLQKVDAAPVLLNMPRAQLSPLE